MRKAALLMTGAAVLLCSCSVKNDPFSWLKDVHSAASGAVITVRDLINFGKKMDSQVRGTIDDVHHRVNKVQSGVDLLMKGKDLIEGAVK